MQTHKVIIVDDETHCRLNLRSSIEEHCDWEIVGEYENAVGLVSEIQNKKVDLVFLDIAMPVLSGIEAAKQIVELDEPPLIVFVTAYDNYAIEAFEICAVDYLLKPFDSERFLNCAQRIHERMTHRNLHTKNLDVLAGKEYLSRIVIKSMTSISVILTKDIHYMASSGNYVEIYHNDGQAIMRSSLSNLMLYLDPRDFCQVHRKFVVSIKMAKDLQTKAEGKHQLVLTNKLTVPVGEKYRNAFLKTWLSE